MSIHLMTVSFPPAAFIPDTFARKTVTRRGVLQACSGAAAQTLGRSREYRLRMAAERLIELPISALYPEPARKPRVRTPH